MLHPFNHGMYVIFYSSSTNIVLQLEKFQYKWRFVALFYFVIMTTRFNTKQRQILKKKNVKAVVIFM